MITIQDESEGELVSLWEASEEGIVDDVCHDTYELI